MSLVKHDAMQPQIKQKDFLFVLFGFLVAFFVLLVCSIFAAIVIGQSLIGRQNNVVIIGLNRPHHVLSIRSMVDSHLEEAFASHLIDVLSNLGRPVGNHRKRTKDQRATRACIGTKGTRRHIGISSLSLGWIGKDKTKRLNRLAEPHVIG